MRMAPGYTLQPRHRDIVSLGVIRGDEDVAGLHAGSPATMTPSPWTSLVEMRMSPGYTPASPAP
jgi:hypothetical protein